MTWEKHVPYSMRLPRGYSVDFRVVSGEYLRRVTGGDQGALIDFGGSCGIVLPAKQARVYLQREQDAISFLDTFQHEVHHAVTDWGGLWFQEVRSKLEEEGEM